MMTEQMQSVADSYDAKFGNLDDIAIPPTMYDPRFVAMLQDAIKRGRALKRVELDAVFPDIPWNY